MMNTYTPDRKGIIEYTIEPSEEEIKQAKEAIKESVMEAVEVEEASGLAAASEIFEEVAENVNMAVIEGFEIEEDSIAQVVFWAAKGTVAAVEKKLGTYPANVDDPDAIYEYNINNQGRVNKRSYLGSKSRKQLAELSHNMIEKMEDPIETVVAVGIVAAQTIDLIESEGATHHSKDQALMPGTIMRDVQELAIEDAHDNGELAAVVSIYRKHPEMRREIFRHALASLAEDKPELLTQATQLLQVA